MTGFLNKGQINLTSLSTVFSIPCYNDPAEMSRLLKTLWEKEENAARLPVFSSLPTLFSNLHQQKLKDHMNHIQFVVCKYYQFEPHYSSYGTE